MRKRSNYVNSSVEYHLIASRGKAREHDELMLASIFVVVMYP